MGLFDNKRTENMVKKAMQDNAGKREQKRVVCPNCGRPQMVVFLNSNDSYTCPKCKTRIYNR